MEKKLEKYRKQQKRNELYENFKAKVTKVFSFKRNKMKQDDDLVIQMTDDTNFDQKKQPDDVSEAETEEILETMPQEKRTAFDYFVYFVYFLLYVTLYAIAVQLKFGIVFFMLSLLFFIYFFGTSTRRRAKNEPSAYSVFNPNVESIDGTLKAEQFEREIGIRHT
ncbi:SAYSvFN domain-containing protein 1 [Culicoides brevitarsis]|uniref:SAYSvFN domain-containing protein 1 n=1 Tax=Culicoides brevitarsis TaxID=469753 RepID=UPI00307BAC94